MNNKHVRLLSQFEQNEIYGLPKFTPSQQNKYFALSVEEKELVERKQKLSIKLNLILQLGYFKRKKCFFNFKLKDVKQDLVFIHQQYYPELPLKKITLPTIERNRSNQNEIMQLFSYQKITVVRLNKMISSLVRLESEPLKILEQLLMQFQRKKLLLPYYSVLQRQIGSALLTEETRLHKVLKRQVEAKQQHILKGLLSTDDDRQSKLQLLKRDPKNFSYGEIGQHIAQCEQYYDLHELARTVVPKLKLSPSKINYYASLVEYYNVHELKALNLSTTNLYLLCYLFQRYQLILDHLILAFSTYINRFKKEAIEYAKTQLANKVILVKNLIPKSAKLLRLYNDEDLYDLYFKQISQQAHEILSRDDITDVSALLEGEILDAEQYHWEYYDTKYNTISKNLLRLIKVIPFEASSSHASLLAAMTYLMTPREEQKTIVPLAFLPKLKRTYIVDKDGNVNKKRYETAVYLELYSRLDKTVFYCNQSKSYQDFDNMVKVKLDWDDELSRKKIIKALGIDELSKPIETLLDDYEAENIELFEQVNDNIITGKNSSVQFFKLNDDYEWSLAKLKRQNEFNHKFYDSIADVDVNKVLTFVDAKSKCLQAFMPLKHYQSKSSLNKIVLKACVIANGLGYGTYQMSKLCNISYKQMYRTEKSRVRVDNLKAANDKIVQSYMNLSVVKHYNVADNIFWANADGQKYKTAYDVFGARHSPKYFGLGKGVVSYSSIMNNIAISSKILSPNEHESHHLTEMVRYQDENAIDIDRIATDTEGSNAVNFVFLNAMGVDFTPCYRNLKKRMYALASFKPHRSYQHDHYVVRPAKTVNKQLIISEWENIKPIIAAVLTGNVDQNLIIKRLSSRKNKTKTKEALWAFNDILLTRYLLRYIDDLEYRHGVRKTLNRGEAYHQLKRKVLHAIGGKMRGGSDREIAVWDECARLIANSVIFYNAFLLSTLMEQKEAEGDKNAVSFLQQISPIACQHINFAGLFNFTDGEDGLNIEAVLKGLLEIFNKNR